MPARDGDRCQHGRLWSQECPSCASAWHHEMLALHCAAVDHHLAEIEATPADAFSFRTGRAARVPQRLAAFAQAIRAARRGFDF